MVGCGMMTKTEQMRDQIQEAVSDFPIINSMDELWDLPAATYLLAADTVWDRDAYMAAQGLSSARNGALWSGVARVLWIS
jgi:hypothetical protein